jgi:hypothetical protein
MVNIGFSWSSLLGIVLVTSGAALYLLRSVRPQLSRDYDIFFAAVALLCGGILFFQGWRQDPILQFGQFLLTGSLVFFAMESIRLRGVVTQQAKRNTPASDYEESEDDYEDEEEEYQSEAEPGSVYRAELDEFPVMEERPVTRRIGGTRDERGGGSDREMSSRRRSAPRSRSGERPSSAGRSRYASLSRRSRPPERNRYPSEDSQPTSRDRYGERRYGHPVEPEQDDPDAEPPQRSERPTRTSQSRPVRSSRSPEARNAQRRKRDIDVIRPADSPREETRPQKRPDREVDYSEDDRYSETRSSNSRTSGRYARSRYTKEYNNDYNDYVDYQPLDHPERNYPPRGDEDFSRYSE